MDNADSRHVGIVETVVANITFPKRDVGSLLWSGEVETNSPSTVVIGASGPLPGAFTMFTVRGQWRLSQRLVGAIGGRCIFPDLLSTFLNSPHSCLKNGQVEENDISFYMRGIRFFE